MGIEIFQNKENGLKKISISEITFLTLSFFLLSLIGILYHEIWLDEAHHWLLGKDSNSLSELWRNSRYEGHPILWNIFLFGISCFTNDPKWMQIFHICISSTLIFVFLWFAPFSRIFKTIFILGYFPFYEYNIISRNYSIGFLFLVICSSLYKERKSNYIIISLFLALASNTHLLSLVVSCVFYFILVIDFYSDTATNRVIVQRKFAIGFVIFLIGILVAFIQIKIPSDHAYKFNFEHLLSIKRAWKIFKTILDGLAPFPRGLTEHYWNMSIFNAISIVLLLVLSGVLFLIPAVVFINKRYSFILFYVGTIGVIAFLFLYQRGELRHAGFIYVLFIISLWISFFDQPVLIQNDKTRLKHVYLLNSRLKNTLTFSILIIQLIAGITAYLIDLAIPYSQAKEAIQYIKTNKLENRFIVASSYNALPPLTAYLGRKIYSIETESLGSFCHWNVPFTKFLLDKDNFVSRLAKLKTLHPEGIIVIINRGDLNLQNDMFPIIQLKKLEGSMIKSESFYIYRIDNLK